jgi:TPR repeat protein
MKRHLLLLAAFALPALSAAADTATSFADAAKRHRAGDTAAAIAFWQPLAQKGDANAAYNLAVIHEHGDGMTKNLPEALKWYRVAAEKGDRESQSRLGTMYLNGEGTAKNEKEGWRWINEHRVAHLHHDHHPQMQAWRKQAAELIAARDMREAALTSRRNGDQVMADLRRRAGMTVAAQPAPQLAAGTLQSAN